MSLLTICQNVAGDLGLQMPKPPIFGSTQPTNQRFFAQARRAAQALYRRAPWSMLVTEHTFQSAGISDYPLPSDFGWLVDDTLWERSKYWAMRGAMSPQKWQFYKSSIYGRATIWRRWRIRLPSGATAGAATMFSIDPAVGSTDLSSEFVFEYVSKNWCISQIPGQPVVMANDWTSDADDSVLDEWLIELGTRWRVMARLGLAYADDQDEAERETDKAVARDAGSAILDLVPHDRREDFIGQYTLAALPPAPSPPGSSNGLINNGGVLMLAPGAPGPSWPTSPAGLLPGSVFSNGGQIMAVLPTSPSPGSAPLYFGQTTAAALLALGAGQLPLSRPAGSLQLFLNGTTGAISVAPAVGAMAAAALGGRPPPVGILVPSAPRQRLYQPPMSDR